MRDVDAFAFGDLPDGFARPCGNHVSVEGKEELVGHRQNFPYPGSLFAALSSNLVSSRLPRRLGSRGLVGEMLQRCDEGIRSSLAKAADRRIAHGLGKLIEKLSVPVPPFKQSNRLVAPDAAGRALATGFIFEEPQQVEDHCSDIITV